MSMSEHLHVWRLRARESDVEQMLELDRRPSPRPGSCVPIFSVPTWSGAVARQLDRVTAIGDLDRFDRFTPPASLRDDLQRRYPKLLTID
jgi:hypothetical protein